MKPEQIVSEQPDNLVCQAAQDAADAAARTLEAAGAELTEVIVLLGAKGVPDGEPVECSAGIGPNLPEDMADRATAILTKLLSEAMYVGAVIGLDVKLMPMPTPHGSENN